MALFYLLHVFTFVKVFVLNHRLKHLLQILIRYLIILQIDLAIHICRTEILQHQTIFFCGFIILFICAFILFFAKLIINQLKLGWCGGSVGFICADVRARLIPGESVQKLLIIAFIVLLGWVLYVLFGLIGSIYAFALGGEEDVIIFLVRMANLLV